MYRRRVHSYEVAEEMKQTRRSKISYRVFKIKDIKRIANVFDEQVKLAQKSEHRHRITYTVTFADDTCFESDLPSLLDDMSIDIKRPVKVKFDFFNYEMERSISFSVTHGKYEYGNEFWVQANEEPWLNDIFTRVLTLVNGTEPQSFFFAKHQIMLAHLISIALGSLTVLFFDTLFYLFEAQQLSISSSGVEKENALKVFFEGHQALAYILGWFGRWLTGWLFGSLFYADWILSAWPNIELDFGAEHLKNEKKKRERIYLVFILVVIPILITIIVDVIKKVS